MADSSGSYFVQFKDDFAILWMNNVENRFNILSVKDLHNAFDKIESNKEVKFLVTIGKGKFFSNGLDLDKIATYNKPDMEVFLVGIRSLYQRLLTFPVPTIAAINGHAYAAGGIFALSHDYRLMRTKKGWFCLPEINLQLSFSPQMISIIKAKILDPKVRTDVIIMGKRYTAEKALESKLVDQICDDSKLLDSAIECGRSVVGLENWDRKHMSALKKDLYWEVIYNTKRMEEERTDRTRTSKL